MQQQLLIQSHQAFHHGLLSSMSFSPYPTILCDPASSGHRTDIASSSLSSTSSSHQHSNKRSRESQSCNNHVEKDKENQGRWSQSEHNRFVDGLNRYGKDWEKVQVVVQTRSLSQIRSHAQKYFLKLTKYEEMERLWDNRDFLVSSEAFSQPELTVGESNCNDGMLLIQLMSHIHDQLKKKREEMLDADDQEGNAHDEEGDVSVLKEDYHQEDSSDVKDNVIVIEKSPVKRLKASSYEDCDTDRDCNSSICSVSSPSMLAGSSDEETSQTNFIYSYP